MDDLRLLAGWWALAAICVWFVFDAVRTQSIWVKRRTLEWPWYYKVSREEGPFQYWFYLVSMGLVGLFCLLAPIFQAGR